MVADRAPARLLVVDVVTPFSRMAVDPQLEAADLHQFDLAESVQNPAVVARHLHAARHRTAVVAAWRPEAAMARLLQVHASVETLLATELLAAKLSYQLLEQQHVVFGFLVWLPKR